MYHQDQPKDAWQPVAFMDSSRLTRKIPAAGAALAVCKGKNRLKADFWGLPCAKRHKPLNPGEIADFDD
jgi:hypothetical protein